MLVASMSSCALCATKVHKIVGMDAPNATFFVWCAKYFEWGWGGGCGADGTPYYIRCGGDRCAERSAKKGLCVSFWHLKKKGWG